MRTFIVCLALSFPFVASCAAAPAGDAHYATGKGPGSVVLADFNGDRKLDLAVANEQGGNVTVLLGDGKRGFRAAPGSPFAAGNDPNDLTVGDFNRDGHLDLAFANHDTQYLTVLMGDGLGGFAPAPGSPVAVKVAPHPHGIATGDFNGDARVDLVTDSWGTNRLLVLHGDGKGGFKTPGDHVAVGKHPYQRVRVADVNGDGNADIVSPNLDGDDVTILLSDGKGGFRQPEGSPFPCGDSPFNVAIGDVDADGKPDLAIVDSPSSTAERSGKDGLMVLLGDGRGGFRKLAGAPFATDAFPNMPAIGDVDGDGVADIVVSNPDQDYVTLFRMHRDHSRPQVTRIPVPGHPKGLAVGDLDGDGKAEIIVSNNSRNQLSVLVRR